MEDHGRIHSAARRHGTHLAVKQKYADEGFLGPSLSFFSFFCAGEPAAFFFFLGFFSLGVRFRFCSPSSPSSPSSPASRRAHPSGSQASFLQLWLTGCS